MSERAMVYRDGDDVEILLVVPWEDHSGWIPPPTITFHPGRVFTYVGTSDG